MKHYLNNAGAALMSEKTYNIIMSHMKLEMELGAYQAAQSVKSEIEQFYLNAAKLINANSVDEIAFMDSASRGWNMAIYGLRMSAKDTIITLSSEFGTNLITIFDKAKKANANVKILNCDINGDFSLNELEECLKKGAKFIAISHVVAHGSIINPVEEIGKLAKQYGCTYIVDGCQAVGQIPVNIDMLNCDAYITTGRKWLRGPRGTGFLYINKMAEIDTTQLDLASADLIFDKDLNISDIQIRNDAKRFELWERSIANVLGLSNAIQESFFHDSMLNNMRNHVNLIRSEIIDNRNFTLIGKEKSESLIIGFYLNNPEKESIVERSFKDVDISISTMHDWDCPLHFPKNGATKIFRIAPHYYTDEDTIQLTCKAIENVK